VCPQVLKFGEKDLRLSVRGGVLKILDPLGGRDLGVVGFSLGGESPKKYSRRLNLGSKSKLSKRLDCWVAGSQKLYQMHN